MAKPTQNWKQSLPFHGWVPNKLISLFERVKKTHLHITIRIKRCSSFIYFKVWRQKLPQNCLWSVFTKIESLLKHPAHNAVFDKKYKYPTVILPFISSNFCLFPTYIFLDILETRSYFVLPHRHAHTHSGGTCTHGSIGLHIVCT